MMKKGILFDMDGVLIDSEMSYNYMIQDIFKKKGIDLPLSVCLGQVGKSFSATIDALMEYWYNSDREELVKLYEESRDSLNMRYSEIVFDGVAELMQYCKEQGMKTAVASSSPPSSIQAMAKECKLEKYLDFIISGDSIENPKPAPDIYLLCAKTLGLRPEECIVVEDSTIGIQAAKAAGMFTIAKHHAIIPLDQSKADMIIENMTEIISYLKQINNQ